MNNSILWLLFVSWIGSPVAAAEDEDVCYACMQYKTDDPDLQEALDDSSQNCANPEQKVCSLDASCKSLGLVLESSRYFNSHVVLVQISDCFRLEPDHCLEYQQSLEYEAITVTSCRENVDMFGGGGAGEVDTTFAQVCPTCMEMRFDNPALQSTADTINILCSAPELRFCPTGTVCEGFKLSGDIILAGFEFNVGYKITECTLPTTGCTDVEESLQEVFGFTMVTCEKIADIF